MDTNAPALVQGPASIEGYADNLKTKLEFCRTMLISGLCPQSYRTPEAILIAVLFGKELGFSPIRSLYMISVIQGTPTASAQAMKALATSKGAVIKTVEWNLSRCILIGKRGDWEEEFCYSWEDAMTAGLTNKDNWKKNPKAMLYARCVSILCRNMWADMLAGLYSTEEMNDEAPERQVVKGEDLLARLKDANPYSEPVEPEPEVFFGSEIDWSSLPFRYHLPVKKAGKDMDAVRDAIKKKGFKFNPDDKHWYGPVEAAKLSEYLRPLPEEAEIVGEPENVIFTEEDLNP